MLVALKQGWIGVSERHGAGAAHTDREFKGTGVTTFDAAEGGSFDSDLTTAPATGQEPGTLGTIAHISGSVDCGGQPRALSTVMASGSSAEGAVSGPFTRFHVACNNGQYGASVNIAAIIAIGATAAYVIINPPANGKATIFSVIQSPAVHHSYAIACPAHLP